MAIAACRFHQLGQLLGDDHFVRFGGFLQRATSQVLDWDGRLGYAFRGLMNEAITLAPPRGGGVAKWLPWLSVAVLDGQQCDVGSSWAGAVCGVPPDVQPCVQHA